MPVLHYCIEKPPPEISYSGMTPSMHYVTYGLGALVMGWLSLSFMSSFVAALWLFGMFIRELGSGAFHY